MAMLIDKTDYIPTTEEIQVAIKSVKISGSSCQDIDILKVISQANNFELSIDRKLELLMTSLSETMIFKSILHSEIDSIENKLKEEMAL